MILKKISNAQTNFVLNVCLTVRTTSLSRIVLCVVSSLKKPFIIESFDNCKHTVLDSQDSSTIRNFLNKTTLAGVVLLAIYGTRFTATMTGTSFKITVKHISNELNIYTVKTI